MHLQRRGHEARARRSPRRGWRRQGRCRPCTARSASAAAATRSARRRRGVRHRQRPHAAEQPVEQFVPPPAPAASRCGRGAACRARAPRGSRRRQAAAPAGRPGSPACAVADAGRGTGDRARGRGPGPARGSARRGGRRAPPGRAGARRRLRRRRRSRTGSGSGAPGFVIVIPHEPHGPRGAPGRAPAPARYFFLALDRLSADDLAKPLAVVPPGPAAGDLTPGHRARSCRAPRSPRRRARSRGRSRRWRTSRARAPPARFCSIVVNLSPKYWSQSDDAAAGTAPRSGSTSPRRRASGRRCTCRPRAAFSSSPESTAPALPTQALSARSQRFSCQKRMNSPSEAHRPAPRRSRDGAARAIWPPPKRAVSKNRLGMEQRQPGERQQHQADGGDPVVDARRGGVAVDDDRIAAVDRIAAGDSGCAVISPSLSASRLACCSSCSRTPGWRR